MLLNLTSRSLRVAIIKAILSGSLNDTLVYIVVAGALVMWPCWNPQTLYPQQEAKVELGQEKIQKDQTPIAVEGQIIPRMGTRQTCPQVKSHPAQVKKKLKNGHWQPSVTVGKNK